MTDTPSSVPTPHSPLPTSQRASRPLHILIIDNYDSFTYNLVQYFGEQGCELTIWRNDAFTLDDVETLNPDAIVVSPGPCTPNEAGLSVDLIRAFAPRYPLLGVCLGHQSIGEAFGATVKRAPVPVHGKTSRVQHDGQSIFAGLDHDATVTRYHSLIVEDLPPELIATAWTTDQTPGGERPILMALRHRDYPVFGVQFHPESIATQDGKVMIRNFLNEVQAHKAAHS
jgi:anthranilate synthase component II